MAMHQTYRTSRMKQDAYEKQRCHRCRGYGDAPCRICGGAGQVLKGSTAGGHPQFGRCDGCLGRKMVRCPTCGGDRFV
jgi:hypothetical protein